MTKRQTLGIIIVVGVLVVGGSLVLVCVPGDTGTRIVAVLALIVAAGKVGIDEWGKAIERKKKRDADTAPINLQAEPVGFYFMHNSPGGSYQGTTRDKASGIRYVFTLNAFNGRAESVGISGLQIQYRNGTAVLHQHTPTLHTGEVRAGMVYCPPVLTLNLPTKMWEEVHFFGGIGGEIVQSVSECDGIFLVGVTTKGEPVEVKLATAIIEQGPT